MLAFPLRASDLKVHYVQHDEALLVIKTELDCLWAVRVAGQWAAQAGLRTE